MSTNADHSEPLQIVYKPIEQLVPYAKNARVHTPEQVRAIADSIREFGWTRPVIVGANGNILAGHGAVLAAKLLGQKQVPCVERANLTPAQRRAYVIADNRIAERSAWDPQILAGELEALQAEGFNVELTGFDQGEVDELLQSMQADQQAGAGVFEVDSEPLEDEFWISVRGPLAQQAKALQGLRAVMADLPGVEVEMGTINDAAG
jgi:ParB-like chromosome segregation protein Spo0J